MSTQWHNPAGVTMEQLGIGWLLLSEQECADETGNASIQVWNQAAREWTPTMYNVPLSGNFTYRRRCFDLKPQRPPPPFASSEELHAVKLVVEALREVSVKRRCAVVAAARALLEEEGV